MNYEEQIKQILEESQQDIIAQTKEAFKQKIMSSLDWNLSSEIAKVVRETVENELKDDIQKAVLDSKQDVLNAIQPIFASVGAELSKVMQDKVVKTMADGWKAERIVKSFFE